MSALVRWLEVFRDFFRAFDRFLFDVFSFLRHLSHSFHDHRL
jgi:hypothetical protein